MHAVLTKVNPTATPKLTNTDSLVVNTYFQPTATEPGEGLPFQVFSRRRKTIKNILEQLSANRSVVHSSPPMSGKSALCDLITNAIPTTHHCFRLNCSFNRITCIQDLEKIFIDRFNMNIGNVISDKANLLIIDDAHLIYEVKVQSIFTTVNAL